jgi:hypothetical protein
MVLKVGSRKVLKRNQALPTKQLLEACGGNFEIRDRGFQLSQSSFLHQNVVT